MSTNTSNMNVNEGIGLNQVMHSNREKKRLNPVNAGTIRLYEQLREPGSAATVHTLTHPSFRGYENGLAGRMNLSNLKMRTQFENMNIVDDTAPVSGLGTS